LKRYALLQVPEVWFWIDHEIQVYCLNPNTDSYDQIPQSIWFPDLELQKLAIGSTQEVRADAVKAFLN
jgi:hypothetical protein